MEPNYNRAGLTRIEALILVILLVSLGALAISAIQAVREVHRQATCQNNLRQLGSAFHSYNDTNHFFPGSSGVTRNAAGAIEAVDGWSWIVQILPYLEKKQLEDNPQGLTELYNRLDIKNGCPLVEPAGREGTPHADALATSLPVLLCPSFPGSPFADPDRRAAITNYKVMGATHFESLSVASSHPLIPKYNPGGKGQHPDGACFPGGRLTFASFLDGTSNTILATETLEQRFARWTVGAEATLVGLPPDVEFEQSKWGFLPKGLKELGQGGTGVDPSYWNYRTYLNWDYDRYPYDGGNGTKGGKYGPSSLHPQVVNHLMLDTSVRNIKRNIDVSLYFRAITRSNGDW